MAQFIGRKGRSDADRFLAALPLLEQEPKEEIHAVLPVQELGATHLQIHEKVQQAFAGGSFTNLSKESKCRSERDSTTLCTPTV